MKAADHKDLGNKMRQANRLYAIGAEPAQLFASIYNTYIAKLYPQSRQQALKQFLMPAASQCVISLLCLILWSALDSRAHLGFRDTVSLRQRH